MEKKHLQKLYIGMILLALAVSMSSCVSSGSNIPILTSKDKIYIVPTGTKVSVIWEGKLQDFITDDDMVLLYKGTFFELQQQANENLLK